MKFRYLLMGIFVIPLFVLSSVSVKKMDLLSEKGFKFNGLGPLLVRADPIRRRIVQVNTISSSVTLIDEVSWRVTNIPVKKRVPQFLKEEALFIDKVTGNIYSVAERAVNIVFPKSKRSVTVETGYQFEMVAVDSLSGNCLLTGKTTKKIALLNIKSGKLKFKKLFRTEEKIENLNQTPPPPLRKVVFDSALKVFIVFDGYTGMLFTLDRNNLKVLKRRIPEIEKGKRLHFAGYDEGRHFLYLVVETEKRKDIQAVKIDCKGDKDSAIKLPGFTEAVGVKLNAPDEQVYIPYDNHPAVHIADFSKDKLYKVDLPSYGNDASVFDRGLKRLYIASWAYGEIYVIDLEKRVLKERIRNIGILPHMFNMAYDERRKIIYIPLGATAVNGTFGSALTLLNVANRSRSKIRTGWGPLELVETEEKGAFLVFSTEDEFTLLKDTGSPEFIKLPGLYPANAAKSRNGNIFLSYGPHQSYWPVVYIWGAKNGIMEIEKKSLQVYDRRISRLAQRIIVDKRGGLWGTQNSWGKENIFLTSFPVGIRQFAAQKRVYFYKPIQRENSARILKYDEKRDRLFLVKTGEKDTEPGLFICTNPSDGKIVASVKTETFPTDLVFNEKSIYISGFSSDTLQVIKRKDYSCNTVKTGRGPLKMTICGNSVYIINHIENSITRYKGNTKKFRIPFKGMPDNIATDGNDIYITSHTGTKLIFLGFNPGSGKFTKIFESSFPYGDTSFDTGNTAFYLKGQFADSVYEISKIRFGSKGKIWVSDLLSGRVFIVTSQPQL